MPFPPAEPHEIKQCPFITDSFVDHGFLGNGGWKRSLGCAEWNQAMDTAKFWIEIEWFGSLPLLD